MIGYILQKYQARITTYIEQLNLIQRTLRQSEFGLQLLQSIGFSIFPKYLLQWNK